MTSLSTTTTQRKPRHLTGEVVRRSGDKTIAVAVKSVKVHPIYHKRSSRTKTYLVHDPKNAAQIGEKVTIRESRPLSARKRWTLVAKAA